MRYMNDTYIVKIKFVLALFERKRRTLGRKKGRGLCVSGEHNFLSGRMALSWKIQMLGFLRLQMR